MVYYSATKGSLGASGKSSIDSIMALIIDFFKGDVRKFIPELLKLILQWSGPNFRV
jgi:hypothetical protein